MIILSILLFSAILKGQTIEQQEAIDFMFSLPKPPESLKPDSIVIFETDSFKRRTIYRKKDNQILEVNFMKGSDTVYFIERYYDTKNLRRKIKTLRLSISLGKSEVFSNEGNIEETHDYENGIWIIHDKEKYPIYDLQVEMKNKGDSVIINHYSQGFFDDHVVWDFDASRLYNGEGFEYWTESLDSPPNKYRLVYSLKLEGMWKQNGEKKIVFEMDSMGNLIRNDEIKGFEDLSKTPQKTFNINLKKAKEKARLHGLQLNGDPKIQGYINWEDFGQKDKSICNGKFRYYLLYEREVIKNINPEARSKIIYKYDVYIFNPWNGEFIEKKRMKSITGWEKRSGSSTGLILDE